MSQTIKSKSVVVGPVQSPPLHSDSFVVPAHGAGIRSNAMIAFPPIFSLAGTNADEVTGVCVGHSVIFGMQFIPGLGQPNPTGIVSFYDGVTLIGTVPIDEFNTAFMTWFFSTPGARVITVSWPGDDFYQSSTKTLPLPLPVFNCAANEDPPGTFHNPDLCPAVACCGPGFLVTGS